MAQVQRAVETPNGSSRVQGWRLHLCVALDNEERPEEFGKLNIGDECTFKCNTPTSREYNGRWYTSINCWGWDVEKAEGRAQPMPEPTPQPTATAEPTAKADDDMPF